MVDENILVTVKAKNDDIDHVITESLKNTNLTYIIRDKVVLINGVYSTKSTVVNNDIQNYVLLGTVQSNSGQPIQGAAVKIVGTNQEFITDNAGKFEFKLNKPSVEIEVSYLGFKSFKSIVEANKPIKVVLTEELNEMDEVVVIGYGTARKSDLSGSISSLSGDKLSMKSTPQLSNQLQGQMAGVQVTRSNGDPNSGAAIRVRGVTTLSNNDPLVIIDGVPGNINLVAPEDVKDIQVLKDAASAAIYGSRAAAGVILITTKRAKNGEFSLAYNLEYGIDKATAIPEFANSTQWMKGYNELAYNDGAKSLNSAYSEDLINNYALLRSGNPDLYADTDFMGMGIKKSAHHQRHSLSLSGGTEKLKSNFSFNYFNSDALYNHKNFDRFNVRSNNDFSIASWIRGNVDVNLFNSKTIAPQNREGTVIRDFMLRSPLYNSFWSDGRYADGKDGDNPFALHDLGGLNKGLYYRLGGKFQLDILPVKGLVISAIAAPQYTFDKIKNHKTKYNVYRISGEAIPGVGYATTDLSEGRNDSKSLTMQFYGNYNLKLNQHSIGLMAGYEDFSYEWENLGASRTNFNLDKYPYLDLGPEDFQYNDGSAGHNAYRSVFGRLLYSWADRYILQANIRTDGSSRFAKGHRWATFPSLSTAWVASEENWFTKNVVNYLKIRASIGQLGNERIGAEFPYQAKMVFGTGLLPNAATNAVDVVQTAYQMDYAFNDITWETTTTYGVGTDIGFFNNKLRASIDYYYKKTSDMLMQVGFPSYFGYNSPQNNAADMHTKGWDVELFWSSNINDFRYGISLNLSDYRSKMGYMADRQSISGAKITEEGSYYNEWYGYKNLGIILNESAMKDDNGVPIALLSNNDKPGNIRYLDIDGDGNITAAKDRVRLGNSLPELQYGGSFWAEWNNFDFNVSFQGIGHQLSYWSWPGVPFQYQAYAAPLNLIENHWRPGATDEENIKAKYPKLTTNTQNTNANSDFYLFNGAYMRIKNISLGYTVPSSLTKKFFANKVRVNFSINDLPAFSKYPKGYDPEWDRSNDLIMSSYVFGLNLSF